MGSSGGGYFSGRPRVEELLKRTKEAEEDAHGEAFEIEAGKHLGRLLADFNSRDVEGIQAFLEQMERDLAGDVAGSVETLFGGSVAKHTYVDGISDVDALVLLEDSALAGGSPEGAKELLASCLRERYGRASVEVGRLAVTVTVGANKIQLLPALRDGEGFRIADRHGTRWSRIAPRGFASALTRANQRLNGKLVPCIKLAKAVVASLPASHRISGYHVESMAIEVFKEYDGPAQAKAMLVHFFEESAGRVVRPIRDSTGQSVHVDDELGRKGSLKRRIVADALGRVGRRMRNADGARSLEMWKELFE